MKRTQKTKRALVASVVSMAMCCALLLGTTFAWFTDSVTNTGNSITAGTLDITATVQEVDASAETYTVAGINGDKPFGFKSDKQNLEELETGIISETLWEPGQSSAKLLTVTNNGSLAAKVKLEFDVQEDGLEDALWFDFVQLDENGTVNGTFTKRPMNTLNTYASTVEIPVLAQKSISFILVYGMEETADNEYQGKSFSANVNVLVTQYTYEEDGFGNKQYDKDAEYQVNVETTTDGKENGKRLRSAIDDAAENATIYLEDGTYEMEDTLVFNKALHIVGGEDAVIDVTETTAPAEGGYCTSAGLLVLANNVTFEGVTIKGSGQYSSLVTVGLDQVTPDLQDYKITVSEDLTYEFEPSNGEFGDEYPAVYENVNFLNCTFESEGASQYTHSLFLNCRYTVVKNCTFRNIDATSAIVKIEEDHTKVLNCTFEDCSGTQIAEEWCAYTDEQFAPYGDGNEYEGHPFCCAENWAGLTGESYQAHLDYAAKIGWNHSAELN